MSFNWYFYAHFAICLCMCARVCMRVCECSFVCMSIACLKLFKHVSKIDIFPTKPKSTDMLLHRCSDALHIPRTDIWHQCPGCTWICVNNDEIASNWEPVLPRFHFATQPQITKFVGSTWGPPGCCRPQMGPMNLAIRDVFRTYNPNTLRACCPRMSNFDLISSS